jgi:cyclomaltodextrinase
MSHAWTAPEWVRKAVFYQIFPDRFCNGDPGHDPPGTVPWESIPTRESFLGGDLAGIRSRLDYLQDLGVTALYLTPFFKARTNHRYDTSDYLQIDPAAGSITDFHGLAGDLKRRGMRLVLDAVFNHCGDGFHAFEDVCQRGAASPYRDWFIVESYPITTDPPSYQTCGGAAFLPKLNTQNPAVREYLLYVARYWLEQGADGWRLDVPWKVPMDFWREFRQVVLSVKPDAYIVAEEWRGAGPWLHGDTVHGVMNYRLRNAIQDFCALDQMDAEDFDYELGELRREHGPSVHYHLTLLGSHDTARILTVCQGDARRVTLAVAFQMTYFGVPMTYYGDEVGMAGENDPLCRAGMIWDRERQNGLLHATYRTLIRLRREHPALTEGEFETLRSFNAVYAYHRFTDTDSVITVLNPRERLPGITIALGQASQRGKFWQDVVSGRVFRTEAGKLIIEALPTCSALVLVPVDGQDG